MSKSLVDQRVEEGLQDIRDGRTYGPFDTAEQMSESVERNMKERRES